MKGIHGLIFTAICAALYFGCAAPSIRKVLPPLPSQKMLWPQRLPAVAKFSEAQQARITLAWDNAPISPAESYQTGLEGTTNFTNWYEVARLPYTTQAVVTLSNRPSREFFRAFNCLKPSLAGAGVLPQAPLSRSEYARRQSARPDSIPRWQGSALPD